MNNNKQIEDLINKVEELEDRIVKLEQINSRIRLGDRQSSARIKKLIESNPYLKKIYDDEKESIYGNYWDNFYSSVRYNRLTLYTSFPTFGTELGITFGVFFMIYGWWIKHE